MSAPPKVGGDVSDHFAAQQKDIASLQQQVSALQLQVAQQPTLAQVQALLAAHSAPAIAAAAAATVQAITLARVQNNHDRDGEPYAVVPRADGTAPLSWPAGFDREGLRGPIAAVDALLLEYGLPRDAAAPLYVRRNALALHLGTKQM